MFYRANVLFIQQQLNLPSVLRMHISEGSRSEQFYLGYDPNIAKGEFTASIVTTVAGEDQLALFTVNPVQDLRLRQGDFFSIGLTRNGTATPISSTPRIEYINDGSLQERIANALADLSLIHI